MISHFRDFAIEIAGFAQYNHVMRKNITISERYRSALWMALAFSLISGLIDCGDPKLPAIALTVFWGIVVLIVSRRPQNPTSFDLFLIRWACFPLVVGFVAATFFVWHLRGLM